ncbi:uncharacterized protein [Zea mays]|uniref:uncharacterized protein n=1 Tax=Zea mays TaxID=4577 RepID=UPI000182E9AB|nr:uncharacterized protein LOC100275929 [Zea mays]
MNWIGRKIHLYNVTIGLYMLDWWERYLFNILMVCLFWYILRYLLGFFQRLQGIPPSRTSSCCCCWTRSVYPRTPVLSPSSTCQFRTRTQRSASCVAGAGFTLRPASPTSTAAILSTISDSMDYKRRQVQNIKQHTVAVSFWREGALECHSSEAAYWECHKRKCLVRDRAVVGLMVQSRHVCLITCH